MPNTVVLTMFREDFKHLIALAHKFKSEKLLASLPDVRVFSSKDDSVVHAVFPDTGTRRTHPLVNFVEGDVDYETPFHILVFLQTANRFGSISGLLRIPLPIYLILLQVSQR